ncbi:MAG TPA: CPBP family glutamic-type intramembrane protease [Candidatus Limnocylindrales bacterium]
MLRALVALGVTLLLVMLRLEAERFGAAEYDEMRAGHLPSLRRRLSWYVLGVVLVGALVVVHPAPNDVLHLRSGDRLPAVLLGLLYGGFGAAQAAAFARLRYRRLRLPDDSLYPGAVLNALATALVDEATFRGALLGFLLLAGVDGFLAVILQSLVYALATRVAAPGRDPYMLGLTLGIGLVGGWVTLLTGGIGAALLGHAVTRFAVFAATGHPGQVALAGRETEDVDRGRRPPDGWRVVPEERGSRPR